MKTRHDQLSAFCVLANRAIKTFYGRPDCCVFSAGVVCEVLSHFGIKAEPIRVEAAIFPDDRKFHGVVLGDLGHGTRRAATAPDKWKGHLCSLLEGVYLLDTTFDQVNLGHPDLKAEPLVIDLRETKWFDPDPPFNCPWTGCLHLFDSTVRYTKFPRQVGWKNTGDFRSLRRQAIVQALIERTKPIWDGASEKAMPAGLT